MTTTTPSRIDDLARLVAEKIPALFAEATDQINAAINSVMESAQEKEDGKAILTLPISVKWDLDGTAVIVSLGVNVKSKFEASANLEDPKQPRLPLDGEEDVAP